MLEEVGRGFPCLLGTVVSLVHAPPPVNSIGVSCVACGVFSALRVVRVSRVLRFFLSLSCPDVLAVRMLRVCVRVCVGVLCACLCGRRVCRIVRRERSFKKRWIVRDRMLPQSSRMRSRKVRLALHWMVVSQMRRGARRACPPLCV